MRSMALVLALSLLLLSAPVVPQEAPAARRPEQSIVLFGPGTGLAAFDPWLVDTHEKDPDRVFTVVDQVDGAPAMRISGERWARSTSAEVAMICSTAPSVASAAAICAVPPPES